MVYANFYSHAREGRDDPSIVEVPEPDNFYSHAREGRDSILLNDRL